MSVEASRPTAADVADRMDGGRASRSAVEQLPVVVEETTTTSTTAKPTTTTTAPKRTTTTVARVRTVAKVTTTTAKPKPTTTTTAKPRNQQTGEASWYDAPDGTCAHRTLPFGTVLTVTNLANGAKVQCKVADRGPFVEGRIIDLAKTTFDNLAPPSSGVIDVRIEW